MDRSISERIAASLRRHAAAGLLAVAVLFGGAGYWASLASVHGAVVAQGRFVVETNVKRIRHVDGGYVDTILVKEGDWVGEGDVLVRLNDTIMRAELAIVAGQLSEAVLTEARLIAQQMGESTFEPPQDNLVADGGLEQFIRAQQSLLQASRNTIEGQKKQLREQISQLREQIGGLAAQRDSKAEEIALVSEELGQVETLLSKGLIAQERVKGLQRDKARMIGEKGRMVAEIAQLEFAISEKELQVLRVDDDERGDVLRQLQEIRLQKNQFLQQRVALLERLKRLEVRSPVNGIVHELAVLAPGSVIEAGETILSLVPRQDQLMIEAKIDPQDVDQISVGQAATIKLSGLNQRVTPKLAGRLATVSPDIAVDPQTQKPYYKVRFALAEGELAKLPDLTIPAGMPVEAFVMTRDRTVMSFLLQPLTDQLAKTFREE